MTTPVLRWKDASGIEQIYEVKGEQVLIGRKSDSDIVLPNPYISRHHAKVVLENDGVVIVDLGSTHGTYLNGRRARREALTSGDRIGVGRDQVEITYWTGDPPTGDGHQSQQEALQTAFLNLTAMMPAEVDDKKSELEKISLLLDFQFQWGQQFSAEGMFHQILTSALQISGAERALVLQRKGKSFEYTLGMDLNNLILSEGEFQTSRSVVKQVGEEAKPVFMTEGISGEFAQQESIVAMNLRAVACLPLRGLSQQDSTEVLGILYLDSTKTMHALSGLDQKILTKLADEAGNVIEKMQMIRGSEERKKMEQELDLARETQENLLPGEVPEFPGLLIRAFSRPTRYVGGDFYDFIRPTEDTLAGILADVSGKGVSASLLSSSLQGALHMQFRSKADPEAVLTEVNKFVCERSQANRFVTLFLLTLNHEGQGVFIGAGHNPAYVYRAASGGIDQLDSKDLVIGAFSFATYQSQSLELSPGDILVVYSDGLTEACDPEENMFGEERLIEVIRKSGAGGVAALEEAIFEALDSFTQGMDQTDDITFILLERESEGK